MAERKQLKAKKREVTGRKVKQLRKEGLLPANIYGADAKSQAVEVELREFEKTLSEVGETEILDLKVGQESKVRPVLIHNVQLDPVTDTPLHADFLQIDLTKKVTINIPITFEGEAPAVKNGLGVLLEILNELEVEALPTNLPSEIKVDLSNLTEVDQAITVGDLTPPKDGEFKEGTKQLVCKIGALAKEEVEEEKPVDEVDAEVEGEEKEPTEEKPKEEPATEESKAEEEENKN